MYVVLIGPQGSGKGTQADRLAPKHSLMKIATGDLFRAEIAAGTELGQLVDRYLEMGELAPDEVTLAIVEERLATIDKGAAAGAVFDGFPRTDGQARGLDDALAKRGAAIGHVVEIVVPQSTLIERLEGRRVCPSCGKTFHVLFNRPAVEGVCDRCGGQLEQRPDDTPEAIRQRLALYHENTAPLLDYYSARGLVRRVNGDQPIDAVEREIDQAVAASENGISE